MEAIQKSTGKTVSIQSISDEMVIYNCCLTDEEKIARGFSKFQTISSGHVINRWQFDMEFEIIENSEED